MAEKRTRRRFTAEFKARAVERLLEDGKGLSEVATELGLRSTRRPSARAEAAMAVRSRASSSR